MRVVAAALTGTCKSAAWLVHVCYPAQLEVHLSKY